MARCKLFYALLILSISILVSCNKEPQVSNDIMSDGTAKVYTPPVPTKVVNNILTIQTDEDFQELMYSISIAPIEEVVAWQQSIGLRSYMSRWYEVMIAEDRLNDSLESLAPEVRVTITPDQEFHSLEHDEALEDGIIRYVQDPENDYWDYNLLKPQYAAFVNEDGLFKCGDKLFYVDQNIYGIALDGDENSITEIKQKTESYADEKIIALVRDPESNARNVYSSFGINNAFVNVDANKKRVRVYVNGSTSPVGTPFFQDCASVMDVDFVIRCEAQKKNIWGNFVYTSSFSPKLEVHDGFAYYGYNHYASACNTPTSVVHDSGLTACFRSSPFTIIQPSTNNGFYCVRPDGTYLRSSSAGYYFNIFVSQFNFDDFDYAGVGTLPISFHPWPMGWTHLIK